MLFCERGAASGERGAWIGERGDGILKFLGFRKKSMKKLTNI